MRDRNECHCMRDPVLYRSMMSTFQWYATYANARPEHDSSIPILSIPLFPTDCLALICSLLVVS